MAGGQRYSICMTGFQDNFKTFWKELQIGKDFCDVTLACEDGQIKTHKAVISSYSIVFKNILKSNLTDHPLIYLTKVTYGDLQNLLHFMYQGELKMSEEDLNSFLEVVKDLNIEGLKGFDSIGKESPQSDSNGRKSPQFTPQINGTSPKIKRTYINETIENIHNNESIGTFTRNNQSCEYKNNIDECYALAEVQSEEITTNKLCADNKQNVVTTYKTDDLQLGCEACNRIFFCKSALYEHSKSVHNTEIVHPCDQCNYGTKDKSNLTKHIKAIHEGIKRKSNYKRKPVHYTGVIYPCNECNYSTKEKSNLTKHIMSIHEGIRFPCDQCSYKATIKSNLRIHVKSIHKGERFTCDKCNYKATTMSNLNQHVWSIHRGESYECDLCDFKASHKSHIIRHIKSTHGEP